MTDLNTNSRIAAAIAQAGSQAFNSHPGATLELMSEFAKEGDLAGMSEALLAHVLVFPGDRRTLVQNVPAKVLNQYIYIYRKRAVGAVERWRAATPDWGETLEAAVSDPARFATLGKQMADDVGRAELG